MPDGLKWVIWEHQGDPRRAVELPRNSKIITCHIPVILVALGVQLVQKDL